MYYGEPAGPAVIDPIAEGSDKRSCAERKACISIIFKAQCGEAFLEVLIFFSSFNFFSAKPARKPPKPALKPWKLKPGFINRVLVKVILEASECL